MGFSPPYLAGSPFHSRGSPGPASGVPSSAHPPAPAFPGSPPRPHHTLALFLSSSHTSSPAVPEPSVPHSNPIVHVWPGSGCCWCVEGSLPRNPRGSFPSSLCRPRLLREGLPDHSPVEEPPSTPPRSALPFLSFQGAPHLPTQFPHLSVHVVLLVCLSCPDSDSGGAWDSAHATRSQVLLVTQV